MLRMTMKRMKMLMLRKMRYVEDDEVKGKKIMILRMIFKAEENDNENNINQDEDAFENLIFFLYEFWAWRNRYGFFD